jgi:hypothetical protein
MLPVASRDMQWGVAVEGSAGQRWPDPATTGDVSDKWGAVAGVLVRDGCDPATYPSKGEGSGWRRVGVVFFSVVVRVLRWVECQGGFRGA